MSVCLVGRSSGQGLASVGQGWREFRAVAPVFREFNVFPSTLFADSFLWVADLELVVLWANRPLGQRTVSHGQKWPRSEGFPKGEKLFTRSRDPSRTWLVFLSIERRDLQCIDRGRME